MPLGMSGAEAEGADWPRRPQQVCVHLPHAQALHVRVPGRGGSWLVLLPRLLVPRAGFSFPAISALTYS